MNLGKQSISLKWEMQECSRLYHRSNVQFMWTLSQFFSLGQCNLPSVFHDKVKMSQPVSMVPVWYHL